MTRDEIIRELAEVCKDALEEFESAADGDTPLMKRMREALRNSGNPLRMEMGQQRGTHEREAVTPTKLYETHAEFRALIDRWVADKRCPIGLVDWLLENDLPAAAEAARWAATEPEREDYRNGGTCGPSPCWFTGIGRDQDWCWAISPSIRHRAHHIPMWKVSKETVRGFSPDFATPEAAIIWLLENWIPDPVGVPA